MRVLFQGAGAVGIAGAARFIDEHEVAVVSRREQSPGAAAHPERLSGIGSERAPRTVSSVRRVGLVDWTGLEDSGWAAGPWQRGSRSRSRSSSPTADDEGLRWPSRRGVDLLVLTERPGDLGDSVATAIRRVRPRIIAVTTQVTGDAGAARSLFPHASVVTFAPALLSERLSEPQTPPSVRHWSPPTGPAFFVAGPARVVTLLCRDLGDLVLPVPEAAVLDAPAVFIPFVAELSVRDGQWDELRKHLRRPAVGAAEALASVTGVRLPAAPGLAAAVMSVLQTIVPIDVGEYAGRHFSRHIPQTIEMLRGWEKGSDPQKVRALPELIDALSE